jgi:hypothetical protein
MTKKTKRPKQVQSERPERAKLSASESLKRMRAFANRKEQFVATVRKGKDRSVSP